MLILKETEIPRESTEQSYLKSAFLLSTADSDSPIEHRLLNFEP
jgi:hypothetical protein